MKTKFSTCFTGFCLITALVLTLPVTALAAEVSLKVATIEGGGASVAVPITADKCEGLGALQFDLIYDPAIAEPQSVDNGSALASGLVEFKIKSPGRLGVALVSSEPVTETGELLKVQFKPLAKASGATTLEITNQAAWDHKNNLEMLVTTAPGSLTITADAGLLPDQWRTPAIIGGVVLLVLVLFFLFGRGKKTQSVSSPPPGNTSDKSAGGFCQACGAQYGVGAKFCPKCGQAID
jgi:hypothetical protein